MKLYTVNISYNYRWIEYLTRRFSGRKSRAAELFVIRMKIDFLPLIILLDVKEKKSLAWQEIVNANQLLEFIIREILLREIGITDFYQDLNALPIIKIDDLKFNK